MMMSTSSTSSTSMKMLMKKVEEEDEVHLDEPGDVRVATGDIACDLLDAFLPTRH
jgi:hypothetical protein